MAADLASLRIDYALSGLDESDADPSPLVQLETWLSQAIEAKHPEPTAMTLATATLEGEPTARVVLLKGLDVRGLVFFTGYASDKGRQLAVNPRASASFFWVLLERQVRVTGVVAKVSREETEAYFRSRPRASQLGAWASNQSAVLRDREELEARLEEMRIRFGDGDIPCPPEWGGYRLSPDRFEFWQGRPSRLHDRLRYSRREASSWTMDRLSP